MKVILLKDVSKIGKKYEVKDIANGHALNHLIPRGFAEPATQANLKKVEKYAAKIENEKKHESEQFAVFLRKASSEGITIKVEANDKGHLFKGIRMSDVQAMVKEKFDFNIPDQCFEMKEPIKEIGDYKLMFAMGDEKGAVTVHIVS